MPAATNHFIIRDVIRAGARQAKKTSRTEILARQLSGDSDIIAAMKNYYDVYYTYHSDAIEGNTLNQRETSLILESGITVGGKKLSEHLVVIGHKDAIDYVKTLSKKSMRITEFEIRQIHSLICRVTMPEETG